MERLRAAGANEHRCIARDVLGLYGYIVTTATYVGPKLPDTSTIYEIVKKCIAEHPMLSTVIREATSKKPQLARASTIDLEKHVHYSETSDKEDTSASSFHSRLLDVHNVAFKEYESIPQWHLWIFPMKQSVSSSEAVFQAAFACSHSLADGMSLYAFHRSFLHALSEVKNVQTPITAVYEVKSDEKLLPALDHVTEMPISWSFFLRLALAEYLPTFLANFFGLNDDSAKEYWSGAATRPNQPAPGELLTTAVEVLKIPHTTLQQVLKICRQHESRLTALLDHLTARALSSALKKRGQNYQAFEVEISMNLRKVIPQAKNQMANYPSAIEQPQDVSANPDPTKSLSAEDWDTIRNYTAELEKKSNTLTDHGIALLTRIDVEQWVRKKASGRCTGAFGMSNLGVFVDDRESELGWRVVEMVFSQSADGTTAAFNVNVANVTGGPLAITLTWWPGMLGVEDEEKVAKDVLKSVESQLEALS